MTGVTRPTDKFVPQVQAVQFWQLATKPRRSKASSQTSETNRSSRRSFTKLSNTARPVTVVAHHNRII